MSEQLVGTVEELGPGSVRGIGDWAVLNINGQRYAVSRRCRHLRADLANGEIDENGRLSRDNTGMVLCLAINYGSRTELIDAVQDLCRQVRDGRLAPEAVDEAAISSALYTAGMPDPDLLIRTAGEMRVSNYLLWQISYAELWVTDRCWPDFDRDTLRQALRDYAGRERRFGGLT